MALCRTTLYVESSKQMMTAPLINYIYIHVLLKSVFCDCPWIMSIGLSLVATFSYLFQAMRLYIVHLSELNINFCIHHRSKKNSHCLKDQP